MNDRNELASLVADVRASLEDAVLRGATDLDRGDELPATTLPEVVPDTSRATAWASIAADARDEAVPAQVALQRVRDDLGDCRRCGLHSGRRHIVFGVGDPDADLVICGEGPGYHEDQQGEPFVGPAGEMLDKMLVHVLGLQRGQVYILNVVKCRPPKNRNPLPDEVASCRPFLEAQIAAIQPKLMLVLGGVAFKTLFDTQQGITRSRGSWREWRGVPTLPTFHPAYLLRNPAQKRHTFNDLKALKVRYDELGGGR